MGDGSFVLISALACMDIACPETIMIASEHASRYAYEDEREGPCSSSVSSSSKEAGMRLPEPRDTAAAAAPMAIYIGGFQGSAYEIWDVANKYRVMKVEAGGWRRRHVCRITTGSSNNSRGFPSFSFLSVDSNSSSSSSSSSGRPQFVLDAYSVRAYPYLPRHPALYPSDSWAEGEAVAGREGTERPDREEGAGGGERVLLPLHFQSSSNGRVMYSGCPLCIGGLSCLAAGGEEGIVKLFRFSNSRSNSSGLPMGGLPMGVSDPRESSSFRLIQEIKLPSECSVRTICAATRIETDGREGYEAAGTELPLLRESSSSSLIMTKIAGNCTMVFTKCFFKIKRNGPF